MSRIFIPEISADLLFVPVTDVDEAHHLLHVLRVRQGDKVEVVDGKGTLIEGEIVLEGRQKVAVKILSRQVVSALQGPRIILACAIPKKAKFETILEKVTELGVDEIIPMVTERTEGVSRKAIKKDERFSRVIVNACKQSKRVIFPLLHPVMDFKDVLESQPIKGTAVFLPWLEGERVSLKAAIEAAQPFDRALVLIGPEGDFTSDEAALAVSRGARAVTLGETVLKVDTAAMLAVGLLRH